MLHITHHYTLLISRLLQLTFWILTECTIMKLTSAVIYDSWKDKVAKALIIAQHYCNIMPDMRSSMTHKKMKLLLSITQIQ